MSTGLRKESIWMGSCGAWHLPNTAKAFLERGYLSELWLSDRNSTNLPPEHYRRCWPFHLAMKPFYHTAPQIWVEKLGYAFFPLWSSWIKRQRWPDADVVHAIVGYGSEAFDHADKVGAMKVIDCPNSHPLTYFGNWQRECDLWCPGEEVPVPRWFLGRMTREVHRADLIIVQSQYCKESMVASGISPDKVMINPVGVNTQVFTKREKVPDKIRFVNVGTICLRKGHQYLFRAFEIVKKRLPDAELICRGEFKTDFRMERSRWEGTFTQAPFMPVTELAELLRSCTAFVFPSQEEGIAAAQVQALASGLPVIGTHEGGATTLVKDGVEGFIVNGRDPEQIAEAMIKVAVDRELNQRMGEAAWLKGAMQNTWQDYGDRLLAAYQEMKIRRGGGP